MVANLVWGVGVLLNNNDPLQKLFAKEGGGLIFGGGLNFGRLRYNKGVLCTLLFTAHQCAVRLVC